MTVYLRVPADSGLDVAITLVGWSEITRPGRNAVFDVVGASLPVVTTEVHSSRRVTISVHTTTVAQRDALDAVLILGRTLELDTPAGLALPGMRVTVGDYAMERIGDRYSTSHRFTIPLTEVGSTPVLPGLATASLGALAATATGRVDLNGTAAANLGALTATASGGLLITGTATASLGALVASGVRP
jgi:hypothetical protein